MSLKEAAQSVVRGVGMWLMWVALFLASMIVVSVGAVCVTAAYAQTPQSNRASATIIDVIDGDTLRVNTPGCNACRVRLTNIDAPESDQLFGAKSRQMLAQLTGGDGATITLVKHGTDQYGRILARVYHEATNINWAMVRKGGAYVYEHYADSAALSKLQQMAKKAGRGVWSLAKSERIRPWNWRHNQSIIQALNTIGDVAAEMASDFSAALKDYFSN